MKAFFLATISIIVITQPAYASCPSYFLYPGVCLDPGHGGPDACKWQPCTNGDGAGGYGPNGLTEAWVNHEIVPLARDLMLAQGVYVRCTKTDITQYMSPSRRCDVANSDPDVDVFISVHHEGRDDVYDTRTFYMDDPSIPNPETEQWRYKLALALAEGIDERFHYGKQIKPDTETYFGSLYVLRKTWMPAALTEASSIGLASEEYLMANDPDHRQDEAEGITDGLFRYADYTAPFHLDCYEYEQGNSKWYVFCWDEVEGADGYVLYLDGNMPDGCPPTPQSTCIDVGNATSYMLPSMLAPAYPWSAAVRAYVNGPHGEEYVGGMSDCDYWETFGRGECQDVGIDREIRNFAAMGDYQAVRLTWEAIGFEEWAQFEIWRSSNGGQSYNIIGTVDFESAQEQYEFLDSTVEYYQRYYYKIRDTEGYTWWATAYALPYGVPYPPAPAPAPVLSATLDDGKVTLRLERGSDHASYYKIYWRQEEGQWIDTLFAGEQSLDINGLQNGVPYCFKARGHNISGDTEFSQETWAAPTPRPLNLYGWGRHECAYLWWEGNQYASGYKVYYHAPGCTTSVVDVGNTTSTVLTGLENETHYRVYVVAYDGFGNETYPSNKIDVTPRCWAGVEQSEGEPLIATLGKTYPNPAGNSVVISYHLASHSAEVTLTIYDSMGKQVRRLLEGKRTSGYYEVIWDRKDCQGRKVPPGVYFCRLQAGNFSRTTKIVLVE